MKNDILFPIVSDDKTKVFYPVSRTVYFNNGCRLSACMLSSCSFYGITCDKCYCCK